MRLGLREALGHGPVIGASDRGDQNPIAATGAAVWCLVVAVVVLLLSIVLSHAGSVDERGLALVAAATALLAIAGIVAMGRVPGWALHAGCLTQSMLAALTIHFWGDASVLGGTPFLIPVLYSFCFLGQRWAIAQLAAIGALFAAVLVVRDLDYVPLAEWMATMAFLGAGATLVSVMRRRVEAQLSSLADAALRDPLTGLLNRRGFEEAFDIELERARRTGQELSIVVGDLDRFKELNDAHGHQAGDAALQRVGRAFTRSKRSWDAAARVGGEEFAVIAPDTDEHGAYILSERVRTSISSDFAADGPEALTASFGIVSFPVHGQTPEALLKAADQALYAAKRLGRNRSVISSAEVPGILARMPHDRAGLAVDLAMLLRLAEALDVRDSGSSSHCQRVGRYAELIARELGLPPDTVERVRIAGVLHDVGRVGMPDSLFSKRGPLSTDEWSWVRSHPEIGARMLETTDYSEIGDWILGHHERPDGNGYPFGRVSRDLPVEAQILGVADAYEAMTAARPYRDPLDPRAASDELRRGSGKQWDGRVVEALLRVI